MVSSRRLMVVYWGLSLAVTTALYGLSFPAVLSAAAANGLSTTSLEQLFSALVALLFLGVGFHLAPSIALRSVFCTLEFLLILFLAVGTGRFIWARTLLIIPVLLQLAYLTPTALYIILGAGGLALFLLGTGSVVAWGTRITGPSGAEVLALGAISITVTALVGLARFVLERHNDQQILVENLKKNILSLTQANYEFQHYASAAEESAKQNERLRITREIHDSVGYTMTTLRMMLEAGKDLIANSPMRLEMHLDKALQTVETGSRDVRTSLHQLRNQELTRASGVHGLKNLIDLFSNTTGIAVSITWGNIPQQLPTRIETPLYRFVQEGMSNSLSHGNATELRIAFRREDGHLIAGISDNGMGAVSIIEGIGLHGMRERIEAIGGTVSASSSAVGFLVEAVFPMEEDR